jgi:hypothetical protein
MLFAFQKPGINNLALIITISLEYTPLGPDQKESLFFSISKKVANYNLSYKTNMTPT